MNKATKNRRKLLAEVMRETWESLESHLDYTYSGDDPAFDLQCCKDYIKTMMKTLDAM